MLTIVGSSLRTASRALRIPILLGALLLLPQVSPTAAKGPTFRFVGNTDAAFAWWYGEGFFGNVYVTRGGDANDPKTYLGYSVIQFSPSYEILEEGFGVIPNGDLTGDAASHLDLDTDTSAAANPDFERFAGNGGVITVQWTRVQGYLNRLTGTAQRDVGSLLYIWSGTFETHPATAEGTVVDKAVVNASAEVLKEHGVNVTVEQGH